MGVLRVFGWCLSIIKCVFAMVCVKKWGFGRCDQKGAKVRDVAPKFKDWAHVVVVLWWGRKGFVGLKSKNLR